MDAPVRTVTIPGCQHHAGHHAISARPPLALPIDAGVNTCAGESGRPHG